MRRPRERRELLKAEQTEAFHLKPTARAVALGLVLLVLAACSQPSEAPTARMPLQPMAFSMSPMTGSAPLTVDFSNLSSNGNAFLWDFGDETTSNEREPSHAYAEPGVYPVSFTVFREAGGTTGAVTTNQTLVVYRGLLAEIVIEPPELVLGPAETQKPTARALDQFGNEMTGLQVTWDISEGGRISQDGTVVAGTAAGAFHDAVTAEATLGVTTRRASASVTVVPGPLDRLAVEPSVAEVDINGTHVFEVRGLDLFGNEVQDLTYDWAISAVAGRLDADGTLRASTTAGTFSVVVSASRGESTANKAAVLVVRPGPLHDLTLSPERSRIEAGSIHQFEAAPVDRYGNTIHDISLVWTVSGTIGTVDSRGMMKASTSAGASGEITVKALQGERREKAVAAVTIGPSQLAGLSVTPASAEVSIGDPLLVVANPHDKFGNRIEDLTLLFSIPVGSSDSIIYQTGMLVAGEQLGEVDIVVTALQGDTSKTVLSKVVVVPGSVDRLELVPATLTVPTRGQTEFDVRAFDRLGNEISGVDASWAVVNRGGTIDAAGLFSAGDEPGTFADTVEVTVTGRGTTLRATATVTVETGAVAKAR